MLDIKYVRENLEKIKDNLTKRGSNFNLDELIKLDDKRKDIQTRVETIRAEQNKIAKDGPKGDHARGAELKKMVKDLEPQLVEAEESYFVSVAQLPNIVDKSVPSAKDGDKEEKKWGEIPVFDFEVKDHLTLGEKLDIIDVERAAKISGTRFSYLKNEAVLLEFALINYLIEKLVKKGFKPMLVPDLVKQDAMFGTGFFPADKNEIYEVNAEDDKLYLIGTAEVPLAAYHQDEVFDEKDLPRKYFGFSTCFRREAGSYGKDTRGIIRTHQFDKVEMFVFAKPEDSWEIFSELAKINEEIFQELKLPYRQISINAGELGAPNAKKIDTEVWIPSQKTYRELTSCSHDTDFQARRLNIKYKNNEGKGEFIHTLNDTALAIGRTLVAILENYQQADGSVKIPKILQKYCGFQVIK